MRESPTFISIMKDANELNSSFFYPKSYSKDYKKNEKLEIAIYCNRPSIELLIQNIFHKFFLSRAASLYTVYYFPYNVRG